jgi:epoxyqueuosine reductase
MPTIHSSVATPNSLGQHVLHRCEELGFALAGVTDAAPSARSVEFRDWLAAGRHGTMGYLARNVELREDVRRLLPGARSVVMVADQYATRNDPPDPDPGAPGPPRGRIARYARGRDYHHEIKGRLHTLCDELRAQHNAECRAFCDTAPAPERELAARAGLGWIGKHTLLINPRLGSYLLLGGFVTTLDLIGTPSVPGGRHVSTPRSEAESASAASAPSLSRAPRKRAGERATTPPPSTSFLSESDSDDPGLALGALSEIPDACGTCTRCIDACPTQAITPYSVNASRCISYLTIERREPLPEWTESRLAGWLFGCDVCQEVCPHNSLRREGMDVGAPNEAYSPRRADLDLQEILNWTPDDRARELSGSSMKRATLPMLKRNAAALLARPARHDRALRADLRARAADESGHPMVRDAAHRALRRSAGERRH